MREDAYRFYVTDGLKAIGKLNLRYYDLIVPKDERFKTEEDAQEEAESIIKRMTEQSQKLRKR